MLSGHTVLCSLQREMKTARQRQRKRHTERMTERDETEAECRVREANRERQMKDVNVTSLHKPRTPQRGSLARG